LKLKKHITVNFLQVIHRFVRDITVNFLLFKAPKYHRKLQIEILILTLFTAFTTDGEFPMGKFAGARIVTDEETEISK
jgi:hypothetical protein